MKNIEIEFEPGQEVFILLNNVPTQTRIRAYLAAGSLETSTDKKQKKVETITERVLYSTLADPNQRLKASQIGATKEEMINKLIGRTAPSVEETKSGDLNEDGESGSDGQQ